MANQVNVDTFYPAPVGPSDSEAVKTEILF